MPATMTQEEIFGKVQTTIVDALGVEDDEVKGEAKLQSDLGAESIDYLDIEFRLAKNFGIQIPRGELFPDEKLFTDPKFSKDGMLTPAGIDVLRAKMPYADLTEFAKNPQFQRLHDLYTVDVIVKYIESKLK